ncbi:hypothetical protein I0C86_41895 [Plantactinospora sp. S1510]|uniref:DUF7919 domain-containing protein n=1 Tax=Plantactinospora alkalitolerans TaxID=2789879 RepID=A0ABS0HAA4_9ACTN|nr:hypothetical protein [Plantactinospora alkalitolerans]MBF9135407.1 hypothetical protein [Plantactinospora alkalitolerans]
MTHFDDLSAYTYFETESIGHDWGWLEFRPRYDRLNIGWLDAPAGFPVGSTPEWFADALRNIAAGPLVNATRGFHACTFCPRGPNDSPLPVEHPGGAVLRANAEIRVPWRTGAMFAAPTLVWHYVRAHSYQPPESFVDAVGSYDPSWAMDGSPWIPTDAERLTFD